MTQEELRQRFKDYFIPSRTPPLCSEETDILSDMLYYKQQHILRATTTAEDRHMILAYEERGNILQCQTRTNNKMANTEPDLVRTYDLSVKRDLPLYYCLHKRAVWSLSMTLKEELAKYKSNIIKPAFLPLYIFLHEMYEKRSKEVRKQYVLSDALWERKFNHIEAEIKKREKFTEIEPAETKQIFFDNYQLLQHRRMPKNVRE
jgi:hypothetical protein